MTFQHNWIWKVSFRLPSYDCQTRELKVSIKKLFNKEPELFRINNFASFKNPNGNFKNLFCRIFHRTRQFQRRKCSSDRTLKMDILRRDVQRMILNVKFIQITMSKVSTGQFFFEAIELLPLGILSSCLNEGLRDSQLCLCNSILVLLQSSNENEGKKLNSIYFQRIYEIYAKNVTKIWD